MFRPPSRLARFLRSAVIAVLLLVIVLGAAGIAMLRLTPSTGAYGAETVRRLLGSQTVVVLETALFHAEDFLKSVEYRLGLAKPTNPFEQTGLTAPIPQSIGGTPDPKTQATAEPALENSGLASSTTSDIPLSPVAGWMPGPVASSSQAGSGEWQPYLHDAKGQVVAYRTFVRPDPSRPYAYAAIVAFDLQRIQLHYVPGTDDPYAPGVKQRASGSIAPADLQSKLLLAAFNGGFKYEHGHFGSMAAGLVTAPALDGMGTLVIDAQGRVKIGEWGKDFTSDASMLAFRQNGPLVIQNGQVSPRVDDSLIWGKTISGGTATMRSGLALSADGRTLYYFAGPSLTVTTLAQAMMDARGQTAIQLDINNFWVHFTSFELDHGKWAAKSLLAKEMSGDLSRYLTVYPRDFFYITALP